MKHAHLLPEERAKESKINQGAILALLLLHKEHHSVEEKPGKL